MTELLTSQLREHRLMVILRIQAEQDAVAAAFALADAGVRVVEFSLTAPASLPALAACADPLKQQGILVGAGTVLSEKHAVEAVDHGADFLVSPGLSPAVSVWARDAGIPHVPGAMTPTEVQAATEAGASVVTLFPADRLGPAYVKDLRGPFPDVQLLATGGITAATVPDYLNNGAIAVAVAGALVTDASAQDPQQLTRSAASLLTAIDSCP